MGKRFIVIGAIAMALAVIAGAFSAHALRGVLDDYSLRVFHTAVEYQVYHALGLLLIGVLGQQQPANKRLNLAGWLMLMGMVVFSGSLYLLVATGVKVLGAITPVGGLLMIAAWGVLAWSQRQAN